MTSAGLRKSPGNPVDGDRFFNRTHELAELLELLNEGSHVLLVAPRRVGKTSLMREAARRLAPTTVSLQIDVQDARTPADVIVEIASKAYEHQGAVGKVRSVFAGLFSTVSELSVDDLAIKLKDEVFGSWRERGSRLLGELAALEGTVVLFVDELPILIHRLAYAGQEQIDPKGREQAEALLSWLRKMALQHGKRLRFVFAGSIGLEPILEDLGLSATANHLTTFQLEPWSHQTGIACLHALARQYEVQWAEGAADRVMERLGLGIPHHVQVMFSCLQADARRRSATTFSVSDVDRVYAAEVHASSLHRDLVHYEQRLSKVVTHAQVPLALDLLTGAAVEGRLSDELALALAREHLEDPVAPLQRLLRILQHDGYLRRDGDGYRFGSTLLRDWWLGRFASSWTARNPGSSP